MAAKHSFVTYWLVSCSGPTNRLIRDSPVRVPRKATSTPLSEFLKYNRTQAKIMFPESKQIKLYNWSQKVQMYTFLRKITLSVIPLFIYLLNARV